MKNILGKGENVGNRHFLLFLQCFLSLLNKFQFLATLILSSANAFNLRQSKTLLFCKESNYLAASLYKTTFLEWFKMKAIADDRINVTEKSKFVLGREENIVGTGGNDSNKHFLLYLQFFSKSFFSGLLKVRIVL